VTRNSELFVDEEEVKDLRAALRGELPHRQFGDEVRLEVAENCSPQISDFLLAQFNLEQDDLYRVDGPVNLVRLINVPDWVARPELKFPVFRAALPAPLERKAEVLERDMLAAVREGDILLYHPFQSFQPVIGFLEQAARDPTWWRSR
jgi:polyphosphate kinase